MKQNIFLLAGRTGGPLLPILAVAKNLENVEPIILGIRGGFEVKVAKQNNYQIEFLPEAKFGFLSFKQNNFAILLNGIIETAANIWKFLSSVIKSVYLLLKYKPKLILSAGSFLAVPVIWSASFTNFLSLTKVKIVIHQQDPLPGLANNLTSKFADLLTTVFSYTRSNFPKFKNSLNISNPLDFDSFDKADQANWKDLSLANFFKNDAISKPVFLIFGGGSGSLDINNWTVQNLDELLKNFRVIHLIGLLQTVKIAEYNHPDYLRLDLVLEDMPKLMKCTNLVLCRAGMGSITELNYLGKKAFLVPLPGSHQEINAQQVQDKFVVLEQKNMDFWLENIMENLSKSVGVLENDNQQKIKVELRNYFQKVQSLLD